MSAVGKTDEELVAALCHGEKAALAELVRRYQNDLYWFCLHYVKEVERARDITQETFLRVYAARARFDGTRRFRPWVLCIARNLCLNELKRKKAVPMGTIEEYASTARELDGEVLRAPSDGPDEQAMAQERREFLAQALETLDEESREIIVLRFFERMQARDIAELIGGTEGSVRTRLHRILRTLRRKCEELKRDL